MSVPEAIRASYTRSGQYVRVFAGESDGYFVLASEPLASDWELLVRSAGDAAHHILAVPVGGSVEVSPAQGPGFPVEEARGQSLVIAVVASAIGAARSVIRQRLADGDAANTALYLGARDAARLPLVNEIDEWTRAGIREVVCVSQRGEEGRKGAARGYVQTVLAAEVARGALLRGTRVFTAGPAEMMSDIVALGAAHAFGVYTNV